MLKAQLRNTLRPRCRTLDALRVTKSENAWQGYVQSKTSKTPIFRNSCHVTYRFFEDQVVDWGVGLAPSFRFVSKCVLYIGHFLAACFAMDRFFSSTAERVYGKLFNEPQKALAALLDQRCNQTEITLFYRITSRF